MPSASDFFNGKVPIPSELRSKEWQRYVDAQLKERAFFMASVDQANILQQYRDTMQRVLDGQMGAGQAREAMRRFLEQAGYKPLPGLEDTIKDLSTYARNKVSIDTNVDLANGWKQRQEVLYDEFRPGWELFRVVQAAKPRDWQSRWERAAAAVNWEGVARGGEMVALVSSPIWRELSAFDQPYPPFDYNSGMRTRPVEFERCVQLGLLRDEDFGQTAAEQEGLNANTELSAEKWDERVRGMLETQLEGIAEWDGGVLRMTDLNGTRPYTAEELARLLSLPVPPGVPSLQRDALREWIRDSSQFHGATRSAIDEEKQGLDAREDLARAFNRIRPDKDQNLYRGMHKATEDELEGFDKMLRDNDGIYTPQPGRVAESWTDSLRAAEDYAASEPFQIVLRCSSNHGSRDLRPLYDALRPVQQDIGKPIHLEAEHVFLGKTRLRVLSRQRVRHNGVTRYEYELEEISD